MTLFKLASTLLLPLGLLAQSNFVLGPCMSSVHGDMTEQDNLGTMPPMVNPAGLFLDSNALFTSGAAVGATSNCTVIGVDYVTGNPANTADPVTVIYTPVVGGGFTSWSSYSADVSPGLLTTGGCTNGSGCSPIGTNPGGGMTSAPLLDSAGGMLIADSEFIRRYSAAGAVLWSTTLPYYGVASVASASGHYKPGTIKVFADGSVGIASLSGPYALFNSATGAVIGPTSCSGGGCALWPGVTPGSLPGTGGSGSDFWGSLKEGGAVIGTKWYKASQWTCVNTSPSGGSCAAGTNGSLIAISENSTTGLSLAYVSTVFLASSYASPMAVVNGGNTYIYTDQGSSLSPNSLTASAVVYRDTGSALTVVSGFPVYTYNLTQTPCVTSCSGGAQVINSISVTSGSPNTAIFHVSSTAGFVVEQGALAAGTGQSGLNTNWYVATMVANTTVTISTGSTLFSACASSCGTLLANNAGPFHSNFAWDPVNVCGINFVTGNPAFFCIGLNGAVVYTVPTGAGFIPGQAASLGVSDRDVFTNPANGHTIMVTSLNVQGAECYAVNIDMNTGTLLWYYPLPGSGLAEGQYAVAILAGLPVLATSLSNAGMVVLYTGGSTHQ